MQNLSCILESRVIVTHGMGKSEAGGKLSSTVEEVAQMIWNYLSLPGLCPAKIELGGSLLTNLIDKAYVRPNDIDLKIIFWLTKNEILGDIGPSSQIISGRIQDVALLINSTIKKNFYAYKSACHVMTGFEIPGVEGFLPLQVIAHVIVKNEEGKYPDLYTTNMDSLTHLLHPVTGTHIYSDEGPVEEVVNHIKNRIITSRVVKVLDPERWLRYLLLLTEGCVDLTGELNDKFYNSASLSAGVQELSNLFSFINRKREGVECYDLYILMNTLFHTPKPEERLICMRHFIDRLQALSEGEGLPCWLAPFKKLARDCSLEELLLFIKHFFPATADNCVSRMHRGKSYHQCQFGPLYVLVPPLDEEDIPVAKDYLKRMLISSTVVSEEKEAWELLPYLVSGEKLKDKIKLSLHNRDYRLAITQLLLSKTFSLDLLEGVERHAQIDGLSRKEQKQLVKNMESLRKYGDHTSHRGFFEEISRLLVFDKEVAKRRAIAALRLFPETTDDIEYLVDFLEDQRRDEVECSIKKEEFLPAITQLLFSKTLSLDVLEMVIFHSSLSLLSPEDQKELVENLDNLIPLFQLQLEAFPKDEHSFISLLTKILKLPHLGVKEKNIASCGILRKVLATYNKEIPPEFWHQCLELLELVKKKNLFPTPWKKLLIEIVSQVKENGATALFKNFLDSLEAFTKIIQVSQFFGNDISRECCHCLNLFRLTGNFSSLDELFLLPPTEEKVALFIEYLQPDSNWFNQAFTYFSQRNGKENVLNLMKYQFAIDPYQSLCFCVSLLKNCKPEEKSTFLPDSIEILKKIIEDNQRSVWDLYLEISLIEELAEIVETSCLLLEKKNQTPVPRHLSQVVLIRMKSYAKWRDVTSLCALSRYLEKDFPLQLTPLLEPCLAASEKREETARSIMTYFPKEINSIINASLNWKDSSLIHLLAFSLISLTPDAIDDAASKVLFNHLTDQFRQSLVVKIGENILSSLAKYYLEHSTEQELKLTFLLKLFFVSQTKEMMRLGGEVLKSIDSFSLVIENKTFSDEDVGKITKLLLDQGRPVDAASFFLNKKKNISESSDILSQLFSIENAEIRLLLISNIKEQMKNKINKFFWILFLSKKESIEILLQDPELYLLFLGISKNEHRANQKAKEAILRVANREVYVTDEILWAQMDALKGLTTKEADWRILTAPFILKMNNPVHLEAIQKVGKDFPEARRILLDSFLSSSVEELGQLLANDEPISLLFLSLITERELINPYFEKADKIVLALNAFLDYCELDPESERLRISDEQVAALVPALMCPILKQEHSINRTRLIYKIIQRIGEIKIQEAVKNMIIGRNVSQTTICLFIQGICQVIMEGDGDKSQLVSALYELLCCMKSLDLLYFLRNFPRTICDCLFRLDFSKDHEIITDISSIVLKAGLSSSLPSDTSSLPPDTSLNKLIFEELYELLVVIHIPRIQEFLKGLISPDQRLIEACEVLFKFQEKFNYKRMNPFIQLFLNYLTEHKAKKEVDSFITNLANRDLSLANKFLLKSMQPPIHWVDCDESIS